MAGIQRESETKLLKGDTTMTTRKQDKNFVTIKNYNKEKEALLQKALEKSERGEQLSESEAKAIKEHFPTNEFVQKMTGLSKAIEGIQTSLFDIVESSKPFVEQVTTQASSLSERLRPVLEELDLQYKENPLTREEIEEGSKFFDKYIKEKEKLVKEHEDLTT